MELKPLIMMVYAKHNVPLMPCPILSLKIAITVVLNVQNAKPRLLIVKFVSSAIICRSKIVLTQHACLSVLQVDIRTVQMYARTVPINVFSVKLRLNVHCAGKLSRDLMAIKICSTMSTSSVKQLALIVIIKIPKT